MAFIDPPAFGSTFQIQSYETSHEVGSHSNHLDPENKHNVSYGYVSTDKSLQECNRCVD